MADTDEREIEERIHDFLGSLIADGTLPGGGMVGTWIVVGNYMDGDGDYRNFVLAEPDARVQTSLGWAVFAEELYRQNVRDWRDAQIEGDE